MRLQLIQLLTIAQVDLLECLRFINNNFVSGFLCCIRKRRHGRAYCEILFA